ncbi:DUF2806 domain-containing protein [Methylopila henanensis]|uniref:DUF2806 domain-containing protein n=1 Tax=Methylopila henanensis TaxID=873516 RepID=A0ABW4K392_9HYPH
MSGIEPSGSTWLATIKDFDWLKFPGVARAIAILVTGSAEAAAAWVDIAKAKGEERAARIRDYAGARSQVIEALGAESAKAVVGDHALVQMALDRLVRDELRKQENREEVAKLAIEQIASENVHDSDRVADEVKIDDDWMNVFTDYAERASSACMRNTWARILKGEIRKPGSISLQTLQVLSVADQSVVNSCAALFPYVVYRKYIAKKVVSADGFAKHLMLLQEAGIIAGVGGTCSNAMPLNENVCLVVGLKEKGIIAKYPLAPGMEKSFESVNLTRAGVELYMTVDWEDDVAALGEYLKFYQKDGAYKFYVGDVEWTSETKFKIVNASEVSL